MTQEKVNREKFFRKTYEELLSFLSSTSSGVVFKALCALETKKLDNCAVIPLSNIIQNGKTFKNRKLAFSIFCRHFPAHLTGIEIGESKQVGYIYFIQEKYSGAIKIGRSLNLEKRLRLFIAELPFQVVLIQYIKTINYEKIELACHEHFAKSRVNGEWFRLSDIEIQRIRKREFPFEIQMLINQSF